MLSLYCNYYTVYVSEQGNTFSLLNIVQETTVLIMNENQVWWLYDKKIEKKYYTYHKLIRYDIIIITNTLW